VIRPTTALESPEELCAAFAPRLAAALRRHSRTQLRWAADLNGLRITVGGRASELTVDPDPDLPPELRVARDSVRAVYRALRAVRGAVGPEGRVMPAQVLAHLARENPETDPSIDTTNHALRDLRDRGLAWSHPRAGWVLGREQGLLFSAGQSAPPSPGPGGGYPSDGGAGVAPAEREGWKVAKRYIWVPMVEDAAAVEDAETEQVHSAADLKHGKMTYEHKLRRKTVPAARCELVREAGRYAVVRIGKAEVKVRALGAWHLAGDREQPAEPAAAPA